MGKILEEDGRLHDIAPGSAGSTEHLLEILHDLLGLLDDTAVDDFPSRWVERDLTRGKKKSIRYDPL
jgi:hypothetical protein